MKFERERDIAAFQGRNWREKIALRIKAEERDPWIMRLKLLMYFLVFAPIVISLTCWASDRSLHFQQYVNMGTIVVFVGFPVDMALYSLFIVPRIRKALDFNGA